MITLDGREYGTAREIADRLGPDITPAMVRRWRDRDGLTTTLGYSPLDEAALIEAAKRRSTRGRPRRLDAATPRPDHLFITSH